MTIFNTLFYYLKKIKNQLNVEENITISEIKKFLDDFVYAGTESIQDNITKTMLHIRDNF